MSSTSVPARPQQSTEPNSFSSAVRTSVARVEDSVRQNPNNAMLVSMGAGLAIGVAVGLALGRSTQASSQQWFDRQTAERIGNRFLEAVSKVVPDSISDRILS